MSKAHDFVQTWGVSYCMNVTSLPILLSDLDKDCF